MRKELSYFTISGAYGGNQSWFLRPMMRLGGCAAATACDLCIYLALYKNLSLLYPFDLSRLSKKNYRKFSEIMRPYLYPRATGINTLGIFIDGFREYLQKTNDHTLDLREFSGEKTLDEAKTAIRNQIEEGVPIPFLLLKHQNNNFKDFIWHWFLLVGYEENEDNFMVKSATYGEPLWMSLKDLWETGYDEKGGMILVKLLVKDQAL